MYRIMIIDDEPDIADSLYLLFKELEHMELDVYKAYSAKEALSWLRRAKIDIVLTDIRMPGMTGLQLMEVIRESWPQCRIIFLTGYNEFDYVYSAIKHNGIQYLLKTEGHEAIIEAVENAINELDRSKEMDDLIANARQQFNLAMPLLQKEYMMDLLMGEVPDSDVRKHQFDEMGIPLHASAPVILMTGKVDNPQTVMSALERSKLVHAINTVVDQYLMPAVRSFCLEYEQFGMLWMIQPLEVIDGSGSSNDHRMSEIWQRATLFVNGTLETIQEICKQSMNLPVSFVIDNEYTEWETVPYRFESLKKLLHYRFGSGIQMQLNSGNSSLLVDADNAPANHVAEEARLLMKKRRIMEAYLESGQKERFVAALTELTNYLKDINSIHFNPALEIYYSISLMFLSYINRWNLAEKISPGFALGPLTRVDEFDSWRDAVNYLLKLTDIVFETQRYEEDKRALAAINKVQQYINEHLREDLSLVRLGELVHFNPSYLSRLFKQITGINLLRYINDVRLAKSKELLRESNLKIHEIATQLGFVSAPYFTRFFKKSVNMSPQEYRDSFLYK